MQFMALENSIRHTREWFLSLYFSLSHTARFKNKESRLRQRIRAFPCGKIDDKLIIILLYNQERERERKTFEQTET